MKDNNPIALSAEMMRKKIKRTNISNPLDVQPLLEIGNDAMRVEWILSYAEKKDLSADDKTFVKAIIKELEGML